VNFLPKIKIEVAIPTDLIPQVVDLIISRARTGQIGDGKIFVSPNEHELPIRTGETGRDAL
jgi:nitrogen regulatory protein P-II 2